MFLAPVLTTTETSLGHNEILALINETHALIDETNARINETQSLIDETQAQIDETNARINETQALIEETQAHTEHVGGVADKIDEILASDRSDRDVFSHSCTEVANVITDFQNAFEIGNMIWITYAKEIAEASVQPCTTDEIAAIHEVKSKTDAIADDLDQQLTMHQENLAQHQETLAQQHETLAVHKENLAQHLEDLAQHHENLAQHHENLNNLLATAPNTSPSITGKYDYLGGIRLESLLWLHVLDRLTVTIDHSLL